MLSDFCLTFVLKYWSKCSTPSRNSKSKSKNSKIVYFPIKHHSVIDADLSTTTLLEVVSLICETLHYHLNLSNGDDSDSANHVSSLIWTSGLPDGVHSNCPYLSVRQSVRLQIYQRPLISFFTLHVVGD